MPYELDPWRRGTMWNNDFNFYDEMVRNMTKNNALLADVTGRIGRSPGDIMNVLVDRDITDVQNEGVADQ